MAKQMEEIAFIIVGSVHRGEHGKIRGNEYFTLVSIRSYFICGALLSKMLYFVRFSSKSQKQIMRGPLENSTPVRSISIEYFGLIPRVQS